MRIEEEGGGDTGGEGKEKKKRRRRRRIKEGEGRIEGENEMRRGEETEEKNRIGNRKVGE